MRVRPVLLLSAVFAAAGALTLLVVSQIPLERRTSGGAPTAVTPPGAPEALAAVRTPVLEPAATARDGHVELRVTAGGEPLRDAEVRLYAALPTDAGALEPRWRRAGEARSDAAGVARIAARQGPYLAAVHAAGLAPAHVELVRAAGEEVTRVELGLAKAASITGRVFARPDGRPVGARLVVIPVPGAGPSFGPPSAPPEETIVVGADASGAFRVDGLASGSCAVAVEADGFHPALLRRVAVPRGEPLVVELEPLGRASGRVVMDGRPGAGAIVRAASSDHGAVATADAEGRFTLAVPAGSYRIAAALGDRAATLERVAIQAGEAAEGLTLPLGAAATLLATVVLSGPDRPAAGAEVALSPHGSSQLVARAVAGADGSVRLEGLPPGAYDVRAAAPGRSPALERGVTLAAGGRFPLRLSLAATGAVEGLVRDAKGRPLASARVRVSSRGDGLLGAAAAEARTDFEGRYRLAGLEVGRADLVARQDGVDSGVSRSVYVQEGAVRQVDFALPEAGVLVGRVLAGGERPLAGVAVVASPLRAGAGGLDLARAAADATGSYRLVLPQGEYRVHAAPLEAERTDLRVAPAFVRVEAGATARLDVTTAAPAAQDGLELVVLEPGGAPSPGAVVTLARAGDPRIALATTAGEDGRSLLESGLGLAGRRVTVRARNGGRAGTWEGELPASGSIVIRLARGGAVDGVVTAGGTAVRGFTLEVASRPSPSSWRTVDVHRFSGERFELGDVPTEPVRLTVRSDDGRRGEAELRLREGETRRIEIGLEER